VTTQAVEIDVPSPVPALPELAKMQAVTRLTRTLIERGLHDNAAEAIAVAVCDPSGVRRLLEQPTILRVGGGSLEVIYTDVWVPAILPCPANPRMLPALSHAVENHAGRLRPLPALAANSTSPELVMAPVTSVELVEHLNAQRNYLQDNNDLTTSVGNHGIREPLLLVPLTLEGLTIGNELTAHLDVHSDEEWPTILTSVDGNSRLSAAYRHLRLDPGEVVTKLLGSPRATRQRVGNTLALQHKDGPTSTETEEALRAVVAPAAIIVGFTPEIAGRDLSDAIQSRLGAIHVAPPKPWNPASRFDLLLNVSLEALQRDFDEYATGIGVDSQDYREWLAGNLTPEQSVEAGLDPQPDFRAVALRWWFRQRDADISGAIRRLDITGKVTPDMRANIAAEGALRGFRSALTAIEADNARRVLAQLFQLEDLTGDWSTNDTDGLGSLSAATRKSIAEVENTGRPGPHARVLMLLAFYWMARYRIVPLQTRGGQSDRRKITDVLTMMCRSEHGMRVLGQVIKDGRSGHEPRVVDIEGKLETKNGKDVRLTDDWIRRTWSKGRKDAPSASARQELDNRSERLIELVREVTGALTGLREPRAGDGLPLVDTVGLRQAVANQLLLELDAIRDDVLELRLINKRAQATDEVDVDGAEVD
jgi:hypothetical protein